MMPYKTRNRRGFTLGEVLVSVAIVAILAAVVMPAIGSQVTKGDLGRVSSDLLTMRGAAEQFLSDVRRYPNSVGQLSNSFTAAANNYGPLIANSSCPATFTGGTFATKYTSAEVARWRGPYLTKDSVTAIGTGYGLSIRTCFDIGTLNGNSYLVIQISGMDQTTAQTLDAAMDDNSTSTGSLQWASNVLKFYALPVQP
jgi:prepilin-type N-terminal cleavage/methylation domain-containing protein